MAQTRLNPVGVGLADVTAAAPMVRSVPPERFGRIAVTSALAIVLICAVGFPSEVFSQSYQASQPGAAVTVRGRDLIVSNVGQTVFYVSGDRLGDQEPDVWFDQTPVERGARYRLATDKLRAWMKLKFARSGGGNVPFQVYLSGQNRDGRYRLKGYLQISFAGGVAQITPMEFQVVNQSW